MLKRFNRTIQEEFIDMTDIYLDDTREFNQVLLEWLIEYNSLRPHQALDYLTPLEYLDQQHPQVLPIYSSQTFSWKKLLILLKDQLFVKIDLAVYTNFKPFHSSRAL